MLLPSTRLLQKRREMAEVERFGRRMERLAQRRQQLGQREEQLRHVVLKFDAFLKRALRRAEEERAKVARQEAETTRLRRELEGLLQLRERLARRLRMVPLLRCHLSCRATLHVPKPFTGGSFQDIPAMLAHFGMLVETRAALAQRAEAGQEQLAQGRALLREYQEEASSELLRAQDELTQLRARLEAAHHDVLQQESRWAHIQSMVAQKTLLLGQIKLAVLNLFQLAAAQLKVPTDVALEDTEAQLDTCHLAGTHLELSQRARQQSRMYRSKAIGHGGARWGSISITNTTGCVRAPRTPVSPAAPQ
uniref:Uncharacterized protein n=1 Tax=Calidris pygmaea TaxID=425635 RepID=A0A8C3KRR4_9CHAR